MWLGESLGVASLHEHRAEKKEKKTMKIYTEKSLRNFEPWAGAVAIFGAFTTEQLDQLESELEALKEDGEGYDETELNDLFWFESDYLAQLLGFDDFEDLERSNKGEDEEEEEDEEAEEDED